MGTQKEERVTRLGLLFWWIALKILVNLIMLALFGSARKDPCEDDERERR